MQHNPQSMTERNSSRYAHAMYPQTQPLTHHRANLGNLLVEKYWVAVG